MEKEEFTQLYAHGSPSTPLRNETGLTAWVVFTMRRLGKNTRRQ